MNLLREGGADPLRPAHALLQGVEPWEAPQPKGGPTGLLVAGGLELFDPLRVALTGDPDAAGLFDALAAIGREGTLRRLESALESAR